MKPKLIFVYNAKGDVFSKAIDFAHKIISPKTYSCVLCALTYGDFMIKSQWNAYLESLDYNKVFYHKEDWEQSSAYIETALPVILFQKGEAEEPEILLSKQEMSQSKDLSGLIKQMKEKLKKY
jgi:hypothetical protein